MKRVLLKSCASTLVLALGLTSNAAFAQVDPGAVEPSDADTGEIVVTAQKREQSLTDVGMSVAAIRGEELQRRQIVDTADLVRVVPSMSFATSGINTPVYTIRGVGFNESSLAASPTVSVYVDQVPLPYPGMTQGAVLDLERVEVLKGPQGTLFGQNATAGAINFIAAKPTDSFDARISNTVGRFGRFEIAGHLSGPISDTLKARVALSHRGGDDWQISQSRPNETRGDMNKTAWRALLSWEPAPGVDLTLNFNGWMDKSDTQAPQLSEVWTNPLPTPHLCASPVAAFCLAAAYAPTPANSRIAEWDPGTIFERDDSFYQVSLTGNVQLGDQLTLTSITAYNKYKTAATFDQDGIPIQVIAYRTDGEIEAFNQEVRLTADLPGFVGIVGGSYSRDKLFDSQLISTSLSSSSQSVAGIRITGAQVLSDQEVTSWGIFAHGEYQILENLDLVAGIRYNQDQRDFAGCQADPGNGQAAIAYSRLSNVFAGRPLLTPHPKFTPGGCVTLGGAPNFDPSLVTRELNEDNISWNAGLNFHPVPDSLLYVRIAKGYKSGNFPTLAYSFEAQVTPVVQESLLAYEAGAKANFANGAIMLEAAGFYYDYTNKQMKGKGNFPPIGVLGALQNIPKSRVYGAELSATLRPSSNFTLNGSVTWLDTKVTSFMGLDPNGIPTNLAGIRFNFSPEWQAQVGAQYVADLSTELRARAAADLSYRSNTTSALGGSLVTYNIKDYALLDLSLGIESQDGRWSATAWAKNVTNEYYWTNTLLITDTIIKWAGQPATYGLTLNFNFR